MADQKFDEKFQDPNTGEIVTRIKLPDKHQGELAKVIEENGKHASAFMNLSRQLVQIQIQQRKEFDEASRYDQEIGKQVIKIREKMGLDSSWIYNIPMRIMERRQPPPEDKNLIE